MLSMGTQINRSRSCQEQLYSSNFDNTKLDINLEQQCRPLYQSPLFRIFRANRKLSNEKSNSVERRRWIEPLNKVFFARS